MVALSRLILLTTSLSSCTPSSSQADAMVNKPLISIEVSAPEDENSTIAALRQFAEDEGFAFRVLHSGKPNAFNVDLFREDVRIAVVAPNDPREVTVFVYALCSCRREQAAQINRTAQIVAEKLRNRLSKS